MKMRKKILSYLLGLSMVLSCVPISGYAAENAASEPFYETGSLRGTETEEFATLGALFTKFSGQTRETQFDQDGFALVDGETVYQPCQGEGTEEKPYQIRNAGNLYWFAAVVNNGFDDVPKNTGAYAELTQNIRVNNDVLKADGTVNSGDFRVWTPIGTVDSPYSGVFDGGSYTISGLYYSDTNKEEVGLFSWTAGTIQNVSLADSYFEAKYYVGSIASRNTGNISKCQNSSSMKTKWSNCGGIVGKNNGSVTNCQNSGKIQGNQYVGGIVGTNSGTVSNCSNSATIDSGDASKVGGIAGSNDQSDLKEISISDCKNTGNINGKSSYIAGVVGHNSGKILRSSNEGNVTNTYSSEFGSYTGGIAGYNTYQIESCTNSGDVTASYSYVVGGIASYNHGTINKCWNSGTVTGDKTGGIVSSNSGDNAKIEDCYNSGMINASSYGGGIVNTITNGSIKYCYNRGTVNGRRGKGEIVQDKRDGTVEKCFYLADSETDSTDGTEYRTKVAFGDGSVTYELNGSKGGANLAWHQTLGEDEFPNFAGKMVYYGYESCAKDAEIGYTNLVTSEDKKPEHSTELSYTKDDDLTHSAVCPICEEEQVTKEAHSTNAEGDRAADCMHKAYCSLCQSEYGELGEHEKDPNTGNCAVCGKPMETDDGAGDDGNNDNGTSGDDGSNDDGIPGDDGNNDDGTSGDNGNNSDGTSGDDGSNGDGMTDDNGNSVEHVHCWIYTTSGAVLTRSCIGDGTCDAAAQSITLLAPKGKLVYDGSAKKASLSGSIDTLTTPVITYCCADGCKTAGTHTASITVEGQTASVQFTIEKLTPKYQTPSNLTAQYGDKLKDVKLPEGFAWEDDSLSVGKEGTNIFKATYTPTDTTNYAVVTGVELEIRVTAVEEEFEIKSDTENTQDKETEKTTEKDTEKTDTQTAVATGDNANLLFWLCVMSASVLILLFLCGHGRYKKMNK